MISMLIELALTKIKRDGYDAEAVERSVDKRFGKACSKKVDGAAFLYEGIEGKDYFTEICIAYVNLKNRIGSRNIALVGYGSKTINTGMYMWKIV